MAHVLSRSPVVVFAFGFAVTWNCTDMLFAQGVKEPTDARPARSEQDTASASRGESPEFLARRHALETRIAYYRASGCYPEERDARRNFLAMLRREVGPSHRATIECQQTLLSVERACQLNTAQQQRLTKARRLGLQALDMIDNGKGWNALSMLRDAHETCREIMGEDDVLTAVYVHAVGKLENELGLYKEARVSLSNALRARKRFTDENDYKNGVLMQSLATTCMNLDEFEQAEQLVLRSQEILLAMQDPEPWNQVTTKLTLAQVYNRTERFKQAELLLRDAISMATDMGPKGNALYLVSEIELADSLAGQEKFAEAAAMYERVENAVAILAEDQAMLALSNRLFEHYATTLRALGRDRQADRYATKAARAAWLWKRAAIK